MDPGMVWSTAGFASGSRDIVPVALEPRAGAKAPGSSARTVRVLDWNLLHAWRDNRTRLEVIARMLEAEQPDVVALQEVSASWLMNRSNRAKVLAERLGFVWTYRATNGIPKVWE